MLYVDAIYVFLPVFFWVFSVGYYWRLFLFYSSPSCDHYCNPFVTMWSSLLFSVEHKGCFEKFGFFVVVVVFFLTKETGFQHFIYFHARVWTPLIWLNTEVRLKFIDFFLFDLFETFNISSRKKKKKKNISWVKSHWRIQKHSFCILSFTPHYAKMLPLSHLEFCGSI